MSSSTHPRPTRKAATRSSKSSASSRSGTSTRSSYSTAQEKEDLRRKRVEAMLQDSSSDLSTESWQHKPNTYGKSCHELRNTDSEDETGTIHDLVSEGTIHDLVSEGTIRSVSSSFEQDPLSSSPSPPARTSATRTLENHKQEHHQRTHVDDWRATAKGEEELKNNQEPPSPPDTSAPATTPYEGGAGDRTDALSIATGATRSYSSDGEVATPLAPRYHDRASSTGPKNATSTTLPEEKDLALEIDASAGAQPGQPADTKNGSISSPDASVARFIEKQIDAPQEFVGKFREKQRKNQQSKDAMILALPEKLEQMLEAKLEEKLEEVTNKLLEKMGQIVENIEKSKQDTESQLAALKAELFNGLEQEELVTESVTESVTRRRFGGRAGGPRFEHDGAPDEVVGQQKHAHSHRGGGENADE